MRSARGNAQKTVVLVVLTAVILAIAGFIFFQNYAESSATAAHLARVEEGNQWRHKVSMLLNRQPDKFNHVSIQVGPDEWKPKVKVVAEITGQVSSQEFMTELQKILAENPCPVETNLAVVVAAPGK